MRLLITALVAVLVVAEPAFASGAEAAAGGGALEMIGAGFALGLAALGGAFGQSRIIAAALESISRNPGAAGAMFLPWLLGVVFVESLVIYVFVIALKVSGFI